MKLTGLNDYKDKKKSSLIVINNIDYSKNLLNCLRSSYICTILHHILNLGNVGSNPDRLVF